MDTLIEEYVVRGFSIESRGESSARLKATGWGGAAAHMLLAALTIWWTFGLGNVLYGIYARATAETVLIKMNE